MSNTNCEPCSSGGDDCEVQAPSGAYYASAGGQQVTCDPNNPTVIQVKGLCCGEAEEGDCPPSNPSTSSTATCPKKSTTQGDFTAPAANSQFTVEIDCAESYAEDGLIAWFPAIGYAQVQSVNGDNVVLKNLDIQQGLDVLSGTVVYFMPPPQDLDVLNQSAIDQYFTDLVGDIEYNPDNIPDEFRAVLLLGDEGLFPIRPEEGKILIGNSNNRWELAELDTGQGVKFTPDFTTLHNVATASTATGTTFAGSFNIADKPAGATHILITGWIECRAVLNCEDLEFRLNNRVMLKLVDISPADSTPAFIQSNFYGTFAIPVNDQFNWEVEIGTVGTSFQVTSLRFNREGWWGATAS